MPGTALQPARHKALNLRALWLRDFVLELLFPPRCVGCGRVDAHWCAVCEQELSASPMDVQARLIDGVPVLSSATHEGLLQQAVQGLKYHNLRALALPLGARVAQAARQNDWQVDFVVPVPTSNSRLKTRGYNQAQLIAEATALQLGVAFLNDVLYRQRETRSQVGLSRSERQSNVSGAFAVHPDHATGCRVLIVDDVCTTGATLAACAHTLREAGAVAVYAATVTAAQH